MGLFFTFNQIDTRPAIREQSAAIADAAKTTSAAIDRHGISTEATGHREVVCATETITCDRAGNVLDGEGYFRCVDRLMASSTELKMALQARSLPWDREAPHRFLLERGYICEFEVHHFWNVVVGLRSRRHAYRCLPDGMARLVDFDPSRWQ